MLNLVALDREGVKSSVSGARRSQGGGLWVGGGVPVPGLSVSYGMPLSPTQ